MNENLRTAGIAVEIQTTGGPYQTSPLKCQLYTVVRMVYVYILRLIS